MKFFYVLTIGLLVTLTTAQAKIIDKIIAVVDDQIITQSMVKRVKENLSVRRNISPMIYKKSNYSEKEISDLIINRKIIRDSLVELGYTFSDDIVEGEIKNTEKKLGLNRKALLQFLSSNNLTFDEYFEITRETIEFHAFAGKIIRPLISITEQEVKNFYYRQHSKNKTLTFKYTLVDFYIEKRLMKKGMLNNFSSVLKNFQATGNLPPEFGNLQTNVLGEITEEGLDHRLKTILQSTDEGSFSKHFTLNDAYHIFYVKKKDLIESSAFQKEKPIIKAKIFENRAQQITNLWLQRERNKQREMLIEEVHALRTQLTNHQDELIRVTAQMEELKALVSSQQQVLLHLGKELEATEKHESPPENLTVGKTDPHVAKPTKPNKSESKTSPPRAQFEFGPPHH